MELSKHFFHLLLFLALYSAELEGQVVPPTVTNEPHVIHLADPTIFDHDGMYYLYGTVERAAGNGFLVYTSRDIKHWKLAERNDGYALKKGDVFGTTGFWAPQVFIYKGTFYMAYVANEQIAIAKSNSPLGPFTQEVKQPLSSPVKQIDPFVWIDDDGKKYLYHVQLNNGNKLFVVEMTDDFASTKTETLQECISATEPWENTSNAAWPVAEGPAILRHKKRYYLFYTANDFRNPDYAVGYATSDHPAGSWKKYAGNPILSKKIIGWNGTGHGDFFRKRRRWYYVFHTHNGAHQVGPRKTAVVRVSFAKQKNDIDFLKIRRKSFYYLSVK